MRLRRQRRARSSGGEVRRDHALRTGCRYRLASRRAGVYVSLHVGRQGTCLYRATLHELIEQARPDAFRPRASIGRRQHREHPAARRQVPPRVRTPSVFKNGSRSRVSRTYRAHLEKAAGPVAVVPDTLRVSLFVPNGSRSSVPRILPGFGRADDQVLVTPTRRPLKSDHPAIELPELAHFERGTLLFRRYDKARNTETGVTPRLQSLQVDRVDPDRLARPSSGRACSRASAPRAGRRGRTCRSRRRRRASRPGWPWRTARTSMPISQ